MGRSTKYSTSYPKDLLDYFSSFLGMWQRELERLEEQCLSEAMQERARKYAELQRRAMEGQSVTADMLDNSDEENVLRASRIRALERLEKEMGIKRRLQGLPTIEKWAGRVGVTATTVQRWRERYPKFDEACRDALAIQLDILHDGGLSGIYDGRTVALLSKMAAIRADAERGEQDTGLRLEDFNDGD